MPGHNDLLRMHRAGLSFEMQSSANFLLICTTYRAL